MANNETDVPAIYGRVCPEYIDEDAAFRPPADWQKPELGLRKRLLCFGWDSIELPTELSECMVRFDDIEGLGDRESNYLAAEQVLMIQLGSAVTAVDFLVDIVFQHMYVGETSRVFIKTNSGDTIEFTATLLKIQTDRYLYQLSARETLQWALEQKNQGVVMFKKWPSIAQRYFNRAAKGLISHKPFDVIDPDEDGVLGKELQDLYDSVCLNIAACLLKEQRYEDVLHVLRDSTDTPNTGSEESERKISEKAVYRRALAHFHLKQLDEARAQLERVNYAQNRDQLALWKQIVEQQTEYNDNYAKMVRKMFV